MQAIYVMKYQSDGILGQYKTKLVAKGYTWIYKIDYEETYALLANMNIVRILLSLATHFGWKLH